MRVYQAQELQRLNDLVREMRRLINKARYCRRAETILGAHLPDAERVVGELEDAIDEMDLRALRRELRRASIPPDTIDLQKA